MDISATLDQIRTMSVEDRIQLIQAIQATIPDLKPDSSSLQIDLDSPLIAWGKALQQIEANQPPSLDRLLPSWEDEGDSQEHLETWEFIRQTIDRTVQLPADSPYRQNALELFSNLKIILENKQNKATAETELMMNLSPLYLEQIDIATQKGRNRRRKITDD